MRGDRKAVALRKESVDRNSQQICTFVGDRLGSLSARRAWIEIPHAAYAGSTLLVALRKESVDRNIFACYTIDNERRSLSARRAWIEIANTAAPLDFPPVALRKESVDRNNAVQIVVVIMHGRSPQGERG